MKRIVWYELAWRHGKDGALHLVATFPTRAQCYAASASWHGKNGIARYITRCSLPVA